MWTTPQLLEPLLGKNVLQVLPTLIGFDVWCDLVCLMFDAVQFVRCLVFSCHTVEYDLVTKSQAA